MNRSRFLATAFIALLVITALPALLVADEKDGEGDKQTMSGALPSTYLLTLTLQEAGTAHSFSMTVASRHFSMQLGEKRISLRGRLWQGESGPELLDYTLEFTQWVEEDAGKQRSGSTWNGSTYLRPGEPVEIAKFLNGSFSLRLDSFDQSEGSQPAR